MEKNAVDVEAEKFNVIKTAAELIKSDIKVVEETSETYLQVETEAGQHVDLLSTDWTGAYAGSMPKSFSSAITTRTLLYVPLHYHFASRFLIETLNSLVLVLPTTTCNNLIKSQWYTRGLLEYQSSMASLCNMQQITWTTISVPLTGNTRSMES